MMRRIRLERYQETKLKNTSNMCELKGHDKRFCKCRLGEVIYHFALFGLAII